ncbi:MAG TPA: phosphatase PAP2 family protein [Candidatus Limnocylindrales bacterium]
MTTVRAPSTADAAHGRAADESRTTSREMGWVLIAVVSLVGFVGLTVAMALKVVFPFDQSLLATARSLDGWSGAWQVLSQSANIPLIVIGLGLVAWLFLAKRRREALLVFLVLVAVTAGSEGVKQLVGRPRPEGNGERIPGVVYSYPSGHTLEVLSILGIAAVRFWRSSRPRWLRLGFAVLVAIEVLLVGLARIALNEHFPTDVLAGLLGGTGAVAIYAWFARPGGWADHPPAYSHEPGDDADGTPAARNSPSGRDP